MVIYYHSNGSVFAVTDGYCSEVLDRRGNKPFPALLGSQLKCVVADDLSQEYPPECIVPGLRLKFAFDDGRFFISGPIDNWEIVQSLSVPPSRTFSVPPPSIRVEQATMPEVLSLPQSIPPASRPISQPRIAISELNVPPPPKVPV